MFFLLISVYIFNNIYTAPAVFTKKGQKNRKRSSILSEKPKKMNCRLDIRSLGILSNNNRTCFLCKKIAWHI